MAIQFTCKCCGQSHKGIPAYHADRPINYWSVPEARRAQDICLNSDSCVIAKQFFFVHGCLEIPIQGTDEVFTWGIWVSLKKENFITWLDHYGTPKRSHVGPFFGWLCTRLPIYPDTVSLKTMLHLRDDGVRPYIEVEKTEHPLAMEQYHGITLDRVGEIIHQVEDFTRHNP
jgi:hypothetical protein